MKLICLLLTLVAVLHSQTLGSRGQLHRVSHLANRNSFRGQGLEGLYELWRQSLTNVNKNNKDINDLAVSNVTVQADGETFLEAATTAVHYVERAHGSARYTIISADIKGVGREWALINSGNSPANGNAYFNIAGAGALGTVNGTGNWAHITSLGDGWYRCILKQVSTNSTYARIQVATENGTVSFEGDVTKGLIVRNFHIAGYFVDPGYTLTGDLQTVQDSAMKAHAWWGLTNGTASDKDPLWNPANGVTFTSAHTITPFATFPQLKSFTLLSVARTGGASALGHIIGRWYNVGAGNSSWHIGFSAAEIIQCGTHDGSTTTLLENTSTAGTNVYYMASCVVNGTAGNLYVNGALVDTEVMVVPQTSTNYDTRIGSGQNTQYMSGNILTVGAYSRALPNNELERMHFLIRKQMRLVHQVGLE